MTDYRYDRTNKLMTENVGDVWTAYAYDENGNNTLRETYTLTTENGTTNQNPVEYLTMTYDPLNRLTKAQSEGMTAEYTYGIDNMRRSKTVNGTTQKYIWDGANIVAETDGQDTVINQYYRGIGLVASKTGDILSYYQTNDHGDVTAWGDVTYSYDAFGNEKTETAGTNNFRYSGEYYDEETGFIYLRNRYYDPSIGRFISEDPIRDGYNWYVYCGNNPVNYIDPLGLRMTGDENLPQWAQDTITVYTAMWDSAKNDSERNIAHQGAEAVRTFVATYYQSRSDWGAGAPTAALDGITGTRTDYYNKLTYHHTNRPQYESMKVLQKAEQSRTFFDVPYHFVIDGSGIVYEGRSLEYMGAHVEGDHIGNIGVALMGNFEENTSLWQKFKDRIQGARFSNPTSVQVNNAKQLAVFLDVAYGLPTIGGHRSFADGYTTDCPGSRLTELLSPTYKNVYFWSSGGGK